MTVLHSQNVVNNLLPFLLFLAGLCPHPLSPHPRMYNFLDFKLPKPLIAEPPLELWPEVVVRVAVPDDVDERVIRPLQQDS